MEVPPHVPSSPGRSFLIEEGIKVVSSTIWSGGDIIIIDFHFNANMIEHCRLRLQGGWARSPGV